MAVDPAVMNAGRVTGCVQVEGDSRYRGVASLWNAKEGRVPDPRQFIIIPSSVASLRPDGCFDLVAPAGDYYVGTIVRYSPGPNMGPPRPGDRVFMTPGIDGSTVDAKVEPGKVVDIGTHSDSWRYEGLSAELKMGVRGRVVNTEGVPVKGLLVFAFADPEMSGSPLVVSDRTTSEGLFQLRMDRPGKYYLRVKESYGGGAPEPGGYVGVYGGGQPKALQLAKDQVIKGALIKVMQVPEEMTGARKMEQGVRTRETSQR